MVVYIVSASELVAEIKSAFASAKRPEPERDDVRDVLADPRIGVDLVRAVSGFMATSEDTDVYFAPDEWEDFTAYLREAASGITAAQNFGEPARQLGVAGESAGKAGRAHHCPARLRPSCMGSLTMRRHDFTRLVGSRVADELLPVYPGGSLRACKSTTLSGIRARRRSSSVAARVFATPSSPRITASTIARSRSASEGLAGSAFGVSEGRELSAEVIEFGVGSVSTVRKHSESFINISGSSPVHPARLCLFLADCCERYRPGAIPRRLSGRGGKTSPNPAARASAAFTYAGVVAKSV